VSFFILLLIAGIALTTHSRRIDELPRVAQRALDEIERATGYKAILLVGGLTPADDGAISTYMYVLHLFYTPACDLRDPATQLGMVLQLGCRSQSHGMEFPACVTPLVSG